jgi:hypothetical protein
MPTASPPPLPERDKKGGGASLPTPPHTSLSYTHLPKPLNHFPYPPHTPLPTYTFLNLLPPPPSTPLPAPLRTPGRFSTHTVNAVNCLEALDETRFLTAGDDGVCSYMYVCMYIRMCALIMYASVSVYRGGRWGEF